jgi:hypothetical protein
MEERVVRDGKYVLNANKLSIKKNAGKSLEFID